MFTFNRCSSNIILFHIKTSKLFPSQILKLPHHKSLQTTKFSIVFQLFSKKEKNFSMFDTKFLSKVLFKYSRRFGEGQNDTKENYHALDTYSLNMLNLYVFYRLSIDSINLNKHNAFGSSLQSLAIKYLHSDDVV